MPKLFPFIIFNLEAFCTTNPLEYLKKEIILKWIPYSGINIKLQFYTASKMFNPDTNLTEMLKFILFFFTST